MFEPEEQPQAEMSYPEYLVVRTWRKIAFSRDACPSLGIEFGSRDAPDLVNAIALLLRSLGHGSRHMMTAGHLGCYGLTPDERQILALVAASQAGDETLLRSHLSWLVRKECQDAVLAAAHALGRLLQRRGLQFPLPCPGALSLHSGLTVVRTQASASAC